MINWKQYWINYPDLRDSPYMHSPDALITHYHEHGRFENRTDQEVIFFNSIKYWIHYTDIQHLCTHDQLLEHYFFHGYEEGRFFFSCHPGQSRRNILYLVNHKTLTDFEVSILIEKDYGVYIPKIYSSINRVHSINEKTDTNNDSLQHFKIEDFLYLNKVDFFDPASFSDPRLLEVINRNFNTIFITAVLMGNIVNLFSQHFNGRIFFRFFGCVGDTSYVDNLSRNGLFLEKLSQRVQYIFSYQEIIDFEASKNTFFNPMNSYFIPLGISDHFFTSYENSFHPIHNHFLIIISNVDILDYYYKAYQNFDKLCKHFNFLILGKNNDIIQQNDERFRNQLKDEEYYNTMRQSMGLYYQHREPRHLHYHPLEAIIIGIPVLFYHDSLLSTSYLKGSPGECLDEKEVLCKLNLLRDGDTLFRESILQFQEPVKDKLRIKNNKEIFNCIL